VAESAVDFLLFLAEAGHGDVVVLARSLGDLADDFVPAMLELAAAEGSDGSVKKLGGERLVLLHEDGHEEGAIVVGEGEGHEVGTIGESLENSVDEGFGSQALMKVLGA